MRVQILFVWFAWMSGCVLLGAEKPVTVAAPAEEPPKPLEGPGPIHVIKPKGRVWEAAEKGNIEELRRALIEGGSTEEKSPRNKNATPLIMASLGGHLKAVDILLAQGAYAPARLLDGRNSLHLAAGKGHVEIVRRLLEDPYVDVNSCQVMGGGSALCFAAKHGHKPVVEELLKNKAFEASNTIELALEEAREGGHKEIVELLTAEEDRLIALGRYERTSSFPD